MESLLKSQLARIVMNSIDLTLGKSQNLQIFSEGENLAVAVSCLDMFVQCNWTGPALSEEAVADSLALSPQEFNEVSRESQASLIVDGETAYERVIFPLLLVISRQILSNSALNHDTKSKVWLVYQLKSVYVHQQMVDEKCNSLKIEVMACIQTLMDIEAAPSTILTENNTNIADVEAESNTEWKLLATGLSRYYFEHQTCKMLLEQLTTQSGLEINLTGIPGKRTRYQEKEIAQLVLTVHNTHIGRSGDCHHPLPKHLPKIEPLNDDTVLDQMKLIDSSGDTTDPGGLQWLDQCLLLALCEENRYVKGEGNAEITEEETSAYLNYILSNPRDWGTQYRTLLIRSITEKRSGRRIERSLRQLEELCALYTHPDPEARERIRGVYASRLPPDWQVKRCQGEMQMELGLYASAMEIFDRLGLWDPLIVCSQRAGRTGKAEELIRSRLSVKETPPLFCSLSDVTSDPQYYHKALQLSNHRSSRAMRGLAFHHLRKCEYEEAIEYFEKTLAINPLQLPCWFSFGCASLASGSYEKAASAFRRCVILNEDNFEAWNNLAAAYARNNQKLRAFSVLQDALKCSYDNWKVWENYTVIGADCGHISEVIRGAHRILELTGKWQDEQVVEHLTKCVLEDIVDAGDKPSSVHRPALLKLLGHTTSKVTNSSAIWRCYGRLILASTDHSTEHIERGIQCLQKGYRCATNSPGWEKDEEKCRLNTEKIKELVDSYKLLANKKYIGTAKLQLKGHIARLKQGHTDPVTKQITNESISTILVALDEILANLPNATE